MGDLEILQALNQRGMRAIQHLQVEHLLVLLYATKTLLPTESKMSFLSLYGFE